LDANPGKEDQIPKGNAIDIENLTKKFGNFNAVSGLNLTAKKGEVLALLGHNGAGKTTTINMITGMLSPTEGDVFVEGQSIVGDVSKVRENLGLCQQHDVLYERLTVKEHLNMVCHIKSVPYDKIEKEIEEILNLTLMTRHQDKEVCELSGGMKRKLSLGMSLVD
jgi:ATP-binding cassette, subfamily A (ABC1), member 3